MFTLFSREIRKAKSKNEAKLYISRTKTLGHKSLYIPILIKIITVASEGRVFDTL